MTPGHSLISGFLNWAPTRVGSRADTGASPWCIGWQVDQVTGWVGTDWIEEYMPPLHGPDAYDDWIYHGMPFNDEACGVCLEAYGELALKEGNVLSGSQGILNTPFGTP